MLCPSSGSLFSTSSCPFVYIQELRAWLRYHLPLHPRVGFKVQGLCLQGLEMLQTLSATPGHTPHSQVLFAWGVGPQPLMPSSGGTLSWPVHHHGLGPASVPMSVSGCTVSREWPCWLISPLSHDSLCRPPPWTEASPSPSLVSAPSARPRRP